jgi:hypothetical protein
MSQTSPRRLLIGIEKSPFPAIFAGMLTFPSQVLDLTLFNLPISSSVRRASASVLDFFSFPKSPRRHVTLPQIACNSIHDFHAKKNLPDSVRFVAVSSSLCRHVAISLRRHFQEEFHAQ